MECARWNSLEELQSHGEMAPGDTWGQWWPWLWWATVGLDDPIIP